MRAICETEIPQNWPTNSPDVSPERFLDGTQYPASRFQYTELKAQRARGLQILWTQLIDIPTIYTINVNQKS